MNKYLIELIKLQSSVILPGFGSLMIGNTKTGKIVFNPHLKFNDGALAKFIAQKEGIDAQAAQNQIAKFVREIEADLGKGNTFGIFQLGKFSKNAKGEVEFIHEGDAVLPSAEASKPVAGKESKPSVAPEKKSDPVKTESKVESKTTETKKESSVEKVSEEKKTGDRLIDQLKSAEKTIEKKAESSEEAASKQIKNSFKPSDQKSAAEKSAEKPTEISKKIPLAEASKKDSAAMEKNVFKPSDNAGKEVEKPVSKTEEKLVPASDTSKTQSSDSKSPDKKPENVNPMKAEETPKKESIKEKFRKDKPQKVKHENPEGKKAKKKKSPMIWIILIIIVGGGAAAGWFYKDQIQSFLFAGVGDHDKDSTHTVAPHDSLSHDQTEELMVEDSTAIVEENIEENVEETVEEVVEEIKETPVVNNSSSGGTYHIIGNSFSSETNAENYVKKMKEKGYSAQNIGKYNGLYLVSLKSFGSREEAKNNLGSVQSDASGAYVFKGK